MTEPLCGINIIDLSSTVGRYCTMYLADMGARVIKVQPITITMRRRIKAETEERAAAFDSLDRNKESIGVNLKSAVGKRIFIELSKKADVIVEDFRPDVTKRLGIDYESIKKVNANIIYCSISGYGQDGPYRLMPGHDPNYEAMGGILGITCTSDGEHVLPGVPIADFAAGSMNATIGVLLAVIARNKYGIGQHIDISMLDGIVSIMAYRYGAAYLESGIQPKPGERPSHVYRTKDGKYVVICCPEPWFWEKLCRALGLEQYIPYAEEAMAIHAYTHHDEEKHNLRQKVVRDFARVFLTRTRAEWIRILSETDTCASPIYNFEEVFSDPHILHRKMLMELIHPVVGKVKQVGIPIKLSETPGSVRKTAPLHGENTRELLREIGYNEKKIGNLAKRRIIKVI
jgi:crotonobetainyl-CoA:carnitine CoA-transferase CaiB-like acyl-CoA transferase